MAVRDAFIVLGLGDAIGARAASSRRADTDAAHEATISSCIGQVYGIGVGTSGDAGTSVIPHFGQVPANDAAISGCIGHSW